MDLQALVDWMTALLGIIIGQSIDGWNSQWVVGFNNVVIFLLVVIFILTHKEARKFS